MNPLQDSQRNGEPESPTLPNPMFGRSPLTDPRSLASSVLFHGPGDPRCVGGRVASGVTIGLAPRRLPSRPRLARSTTVPQPRAQAGPRGRSAATLFPKNSGSRPMAAPPNRRRWRDPAAEALLADVLPAPTSPDASLRALPGPLTSGVGVVPGGGTGGGGGSGGGFGRGASVEAAGRGPSSSVPASRPRSFAYVIDCSGSMSENGGARPGQARIARQPRPAPAGRPVRP